MRHGLGLQVRFAVRQDEADDLIEELLRRESAPRRLILVSDDHRLQQAARRRECQVQGCDEFLDWLDRRGRPEEGPPEARPEKRERLSPGETQRWLNEFADLADDPGFKELFEPYHFEEG